MATSQMPLRQDIRHKSYDLLPVLVAMPHLSYKDPNGCEFELPIDSHLPWDCQRLSFDRFLVGNGTRYLALIDKGAVTAVAPASYAPHVPVTPHTGQLVDNMNGGEIKILGQYVTHKVVMIITFLIVADVVNPIIGLDALHQDAVQFHLSQSGKVYLQRKDHRAVLHYASGITTILQVWSFKGS